MQAASLLQNIGQHQLNPSPRALLLAADVWDAYFAEGTLPACGTKANFTYKHWGEPLPDSVALATNGSGPGVAVNGHQKDTYLWSEVRSAGASAVPNVTRAHADCASCLIWLRRSCH